MNKRFNPQIKDLSEPTWKLSYNIKIIASLRKFNSQINVYYLLKIGNNIIKQSNKNLDRLIIIILYEGTTSHREDGLHRTEI